MRYARWICVALALAQGGYMTFGAAKALIGGDYLTPKYGPHAGELGAWSRLVSAVGIPPRSTAMKSLFLVLGLIWIASSLAFAASVSWAWWALVVVAAGSLWYLPIGTALSVLILVLLFLPAVRALQ